MEGTGVTSTAAMPITSPDSREAPPASGKGQGKKKGKGSAKTTGPSMARATHTSAAPPPTTASSPTAPSTSSVDVPPSAPRMYARAAAAPPPATSSSLPPTVSATINSVRGPFLTMRRKHGVRCLLVPASPHMETYVQALARVVGPSAIVAASKMYGKVVFLTLEAAAQEADLGIRLVLTSVPPFLPNAALLPALSILGKPVSVISPLPLGCKDTTPRHIFSFCRQVQLLLPSTACDGVALEGSFLVPHQVARYQVYFSTGEARRYLCRASGHVRKDCPLVQQGGASGIPETRQDTSPVIADAPGRPVPKPAPPHLWTTATPAQAQGAPPLQRPDERESPALAADNLAGPMEKGVAEIPPGMGESLPQGESSLPYAAPPFPPQVPEPSPLPPDTTPANQPLDDAMEGWAIVQGK
ncbi:unnamed protein product [Caretta caretta]